MLNREQKESVVSALREEFQGAQAAFLTTSGGVPVEEVRQLRLELHREGVRYRVVKNTLARRAVEGTPFSGLAAHFEGPTAIVLTRGDAASTARVLRDYLKKNEKIKLKVGLLDGKTLTPEEVNALASLPGRNELRAMLLSALNGVPQRFLSTLAAPARDFVSVLDAREKKLAESGQSV